MTAVRDIERLQDFWEARYRDFSLSESGWLGAGEALNRRLYACKAQALRRSLAAAGVRKAAPLSVLDAGCGQGFFADFYGREYPAGSYTGFDLCPRAVEHIRLTRPGADVHVGDLTNWRDPAGRRFDVVQSFDVLYLVLDDDIVRAALRNLACLLAPGGALLVTAALPRDTIERRGYLRYRSRQFWHDAVRDAELEIVAERRMYFWLPTGGPLNRYLRRLVTMFGLPCVYALDRIALLARVPQPDSVSPDCRMRLLTLRHAR